MLRCNLPTGGRCQASYAMKEYHHALKKDTQDDRSASCAVRDGDMQCQSREETGSDRNEDVQMGMWPCTHTM